MGSSHETQKSQDCFTGGGAWTTGIPRALISQSDFVDPENGDLKPRGLEKKYDFAYSNLAGAWNDVNRNWTLAKECIKLAAHQGMKVLIVGKKKDQVGCFLPFLCRTALIVNETLVIIPVAILL